PASMVPASRPIASRAAEFLRRVAAEANSVIDKEIPVLVTLTEDPAGAVPDPASGRVCGATNRPPASSALANQALLLRFAGIPLRFPG
ncbi:MAG: hypothetical protein ACN4E6_11155, partial [Qipengyuania pacifica]